MTDLLRSEEYLPLMLWSSKVGREGGTERGGSGGGRGKDGGMGEGGERR